MNKFYKSRRLHLLFEEKAGVFEALDMFSDWGADDLIYNSFDDYVIKRTAQFLTKREVQTTWTEPEVVMLVLEREVMNSFGEEIWRVIAGEKTGWIRVTFLGAMEEVNEKQ